MSLIDSPAPPPAVVHDALLRLHRWLAEVDYQFTTITPASHSRVLERTSAPARDLRDVFGWSRSFAAGLLGDLPMAWLRQARLLQPAGAGAGPEQGLLRSRVRFSSCGGSLFAHSAFPTDGADAVFFGPDTYRFASLIDAELSRLPLPPRARILDVGCGSGAGGILAARHPAAAGAGLVLTDINPAALMHAGANAEAAGLREVPCLQGDLFAPTRGDFDLIVANPPYLVDPAARAYRHGGGTLGSALSERIVSEGLDRLAPGGRLVLYTGSPIVRGEDRFRRATQQIVARCGWPTRYGEIDPDVFGEELEQPAYADTERIAAVALVVQRPG